MAAYYIEGSAGRWRRAEDCVGCEVARSRGKDGHGGNQDGRCGLSLALNNQPGPLWPGVAGDPSRPACLPICLSDPERRGPRLLDICGCSPSTRFAERIAHKNMSMVLLVLWLLQPRLG
ncbi:hypothetical protein NDU88_004772 [Pleurodeles waltl]|uniref:Uncharacterized protein n=1 Tax=Pleurodeles waltl TaxID=8319 RepID=A0AAV7TSG1_PLEWA|nr:hypothetical protein NDU88_004772 [Pleurodeles waltl]